MGHSAKTTASSELVIEVPETFANYIDAAVVRLGYLMPELQFSAQNGAIRSLLVDDADADRVRRDVLHAIYRERIYTDTIELRRSLLRTLVK